MERFNRLKALILTKSFEPQFSANVKVTPTHSPPSSIEQGSEPFIRPSSSAVLPGTGFSAEKHQPTSKAMTSQQSSSSKFPGTGSSANKHQPASKTKTSRPASSTKVTGQGSSTTYQPTSQTKTDRPTPAGNLGTDPTPLAQHDTHRPPTTDRPTPSDTADSGSPALHRTRRDSFSSLSSEDGSEMSDRPPLDLYAEEGEWLEEHSIIGQDHPVSEEQNYRDTMQGIRFYMGWSHFPGGKGRPERPLLYVTRLLALIAALFKISRI